MIPELAARAPNAPKRPVLDEQGRVAVPFHPPGGDGAEETVTTARLRAASAAAEAAESRRLLYVALTRARDKLVLSGADGRITAGTWADAMSAVPDSLLARVPAPAETGSVPVAPSQAPSPELPPDPPRLRPEPPPQPVRISVTSLAEYARCPRRHWLASQMRLPEPRAAAAGAAGSAALADAAALAGAGALPGAAADAMGPAGDDPERATARGTLAHAMLAEVDLAAPPGARRALLEAAAARRGDDPRRPGVRRIVDDVERFLAGPAGNQLAAAARAGRLRRELPFLLRLDGAPACYLDGAIDALDAGEGEVAVLDFKYAHFHPGAAERYRLQLAAYALAVTRAFPGRRVRAVLHFLRSMDEVDVTPTPADLERLAAELPVLAISAVRAERRDASPAELGRDEARCRAEGCGFVLRCFGASSAKSA